MSDDEPETAAVLADPDAVRDIQEGVADVEAGRVVPAAEVEADLRNPSGTTYFDNERDFEAFLDSQPAADDPRPEPDIGGQQ